MISGVPGVDASVGAGFEGSSPDILEAVRARALRMASLLFTAAGMAGVLVLGFAGLSALSALIDLAVTLRKALGVTAPVEGRDWYLLAVSAVCVGLPASAVLVAYRGYRRVWLRRVAAVWGPDLGRRELRRVSTFAVAPPPSDGPARDQRIETLRRLLSSSAWEPKWGRLQSLIGPDWPTDHHPRTLSEDAFPAVAAAVLRCVEADVAARATAVGLSVGISHNRWVDTTTIVAASLEIQLAVLSRLGKRPSWRVWRRLARNCGASVLVNTYLNRGDVLALNLAVQKAAMGFQVLADLTSEGLDLLRDLDLDEALDAVFDVVDIPGGGVAGTVTRTALYGLLSTTEFGLGVGEIGLRHLASLTQRLADELVQGVIAGGILYHHGMSLAADVLALDADHRRSPSLNRSMLAGMTEMKNAAQELATHQVKALRDAYRQRRRQSIGRLSNSSSLPDRVRRRAERAAGKATSDGEE